MDDMNLLEAVVFSWELVSLLALVGLSVGLYLAGSTYLIERTVKHDALEEITAAGEPAWTKDGLSVLGVKKSLDQMLSRVFGRGPVFRLVRLWQESGLGQGPTGLLGALTVISMGGFFLVFALTDRLLLGVFSAAGLLTGFISVVFYRAGLQRRKFQDQFSSLIDRLADSLQAGYTLPQAIHFVGPGLLEPSCSEMHRVDKMLQMGFPLAEALGDLQHRHSFEDLTLFVETLKLHQKVGGDIVRMFRELAEVVRERIELEKEIRTLTAQGRLSAVVITLLVPVSLGVLAFFPGYIDILFQTTPGNLVLISAVLLDGLGAIIVRRLIQIEV